MSNFYNTFAWAMGSTMRLLGKSLMKKFEEIDFNMTIEQFGFLHMLSLNSEAIQSDIAQMMNKDKSAVMRHIDAMEQRNWVLRINDETDRRKKILQLTDEGQEQLEKALEILGEVMEELTQGISKEEMEAVIATLSKIKQNASN